MSGADWFREAFGLHYLAVYPHRSDEAARPEAAFAARALALAPGARILDLACGAGRHARALAALGFRVAGVDLSGDLIEAARRRGGGPLYARGDLRALPFLPRFDAACLFFTSFGYFATEAENAHVLAEAARVLAPGGGLLLDLPNREHVVANLVAESVDRAGDLRIESRRRLTADLRRVEKSVRVIDEAGARVAEYVESVRLYERAEAEAMLVAAGFAVADRFGDLAGVPCSTTAPRFVTVSRRVAR